MLVTLPIPTIRIPLCGIRPLRGNLPPVKGTSIELPALKDILDKSLSDSHGKILSNIAQSHSNPSQSLFNVVYLPEHRIWQAELFTQPVLLVGLKFGFLGYEGPWYTPGDPISWIEKQDGASGDLETMLSLRVNGLSHIRNQVIIASVHAKHRDKIPDVLDVSAQFQLPYRTALSFSHSPGYPAFSVEDFSGDDFVCDAVLAISNQLIDDPRI